MSKQHGRKPEAPRTEQPVEKAVEQTPKRVIQPHRHCPLCWEGRGGYGTAYSKQGRTTYYRCDQTTKPDGLGPCGHTWSAILRIEAVKIEHRIVELDGER